MKAITIHQPWPELIFADHQLLQRHGLGPPKRVENRTRKTSHREAFLVHASKDRKICNAEPQVYETFPDMPFGAIVGKVDLVACFTLEELAESVEQLGCGWPFAWVQSHRWTEGPACWVLENPVRFPKPIPAIGSQGWWNYEGPLPEPPPITTAIHAGGEILEPYPNSW